MTGEPRTEYPPAAKQASRPTAMGELVSVTMHEHNSVAVAAIIGEVDISNVDIVTSALNSVSNLVSGLVVDLRGVEYLDSSAIALLHELAIRMQDRSQRLIVVCPPDSPPRHVLELTALSARVLVLDELAPAIDAIRAPDD